MQKSVTDKYSAASLILKEKDDMGALLIGDCTSSVDKHVLKPFKIQTIITIGQDSLPQKKQEGINYILHNVLDNKSQKISDMFDPMFQQIQEARKAGGVLINCYTGISRSASFVIAYLMRKKFMNYDDSKAFVKKQRNVIHPNDNFHHQLQSYWKILVKREEEERLKKQKVQIQVKQKQTVINTSQVLSSNFSSISKKSKGVKGAVKPAFRSESIQNKSINEQKTIEDTSQQTAQKVNNNPRSPRAESGNKLKKEQKNKQVKGVYSNKTKVM